jgi:tetratricopeptide (TPR) repeat protein
MKQAEQKKAEANALFTVQKYREAVKKYTEAIQLYPFAGVYYLNRVHTLLCVFDSGCNLQTFNSPCSNW